MKAADYQVAAQEEIQRLSTRYTPTEVATLLGLMYMMTYVHLEFTKPDPMNEERWQDLVDHSRAVARGYADLVRSQLN